MMKNQTVIDMTSAYTYDEAAFSDLYKDTYGSRPRDHFFYSATPAEKQKIWDDLLSAHEVEMEYYHSHQRLAILNIESAIALNIDAGAPDRAGALRWLMQSEDAGSIEELEFIFDLPYGYLMKETVNA
jgi:hypothetical protein